MNTTAAIQIERSKLVRMRDLFNNHAKHKKGPEWLFLMSESARLTAEIGKLGPGNRRIRRAAERREKVGRWAPKSGRGV